MALYNFLFCFYFLNALSGFYPHLHFFLSLFLPLATLFVPHLPLHIDIHNTEQSGNENSEG